MATALPNLISAQEIDQLTQIGNDAVILFQGDSITDGNRTRDNDWNHVMGHGYAYLIASRLWFDHPEKHFHFLNRGISGNRVTDLTERWQKDTIDLKPNILSILIGLNDITQFLAGDASYDAGNYEAGYHALIKQTKEQLSNVQFVICAPFILPGAHVSKNFDLWQAEVTKRQLIAKKLAEEFGAIFIDFQEQFNQALTKAPADYWIWDGIHPMPAGHELMARHWIKEVNKHIKLG
ncbi:SGNH/GDSL hydrolase family protein [Mucilaginibacter sp. ZB1P21]|uniref:SGNH/GDSL hydrolase family protein n=2 Tax=Mucilaginibacter glaciei TaxID=2772109 RepID=A0A926NWT0_9SPHI|nr:SGNH/GDSL hydrolase family protein [Mucilaginibacter glaciei]